MKTAIGTFIALALLALTGCASTTSPAYHAAPGNRADGVQGVDYVVEHPPTNGWAIKGAKQ